MAVGWPIATDLLGGTLAMRAAGVHRLPMFAKESADSYAERIKVATLFPAYERTVSVMGGKPFSKELNLKEVPATIEALAEDIDRQGNSLHIFANALFNDCLAYGLEGILVDAPPKLVIPGGRAASVLEEAQAGVRPYFKRIFHNDILGWKELTVLGVRTLSQLRLREFNTVDDGDYGSIEVPRVRVLRPGLWEIWEITTEKDVQGEYIYKLIAGGTTSLKYIPFVPFYGIRDDFMRGRSPLENLAYLNVKHWQSQSDQDTILHVARVPIIVMIGAEDKSQLTVGAASAIKLPMGADMKFVEITGMSIDAGQNSLSALEDQMVQTGAELLVMKAVARTATETATDAQGNKCDLQRMCEIFEDGLDEALDMLGDYLGLGRDAAGNAELFKDFGAASLDSAGAGTITALQGAGLITRVTALKEHQRRGVLSADLNPETEIANVEAEAPALGTYQEEKMPTPPAPAGGLPPTKAKKK